MSRRHLLRATAVAFATATLFGGIFALQLWIHRMTTGYAEDAPEGWTFLIAAVRWWGWAALTPVVFALADRFQIGRRSPLTAIGFHLVLGIVLSIVHIAAIGLLLPWPIGASPELKIDLRLALAWLILDRGADNIVNYTIVAAAYHASDYILRLHEAEKATSVSDERYRAFVAHSTEAIWCFSFEPPLDIGIPVEAQVAAAYDSCRLYDCNDQMAQMYGFENAEQIIGAPLGSMLPPTPANLAFLEALARSEYRLKDYESEERRPDGRITYVLNNTDGIVENGKLVRVWGTQREITERKRLEEELRQSQKMEAIGRLAGGIAHDFNNLLTVVQGHLQLLLERLTPGNPLRPDLEEIDRAASRASSLTRQLLAFSRRQILQPRRVDLVAVVGEMEKLLRRLIGEDVRLETRAQSPSAPVDADPSQLEQILLNLAVNARDAMPYGGTFRIETGSVAVRPGDEEGVPPGDYIALTVADTGVGMTEETKQHIFEPFFTTKEQGKGTGLGLSMVYGIVKQSGGEISIDSAPGQGTTFRILLPRSRTADGEAEPPAPAVTPAAPAPTASRILLVEDDEAVRSLVRRSLERMGMTVLTAPDGDSALQIAREIGEIDLLLTDITMPGMDGRELVRRLRAADPSIRALLMSGYARGEALRDGGDPAAGFLQKPFTPTELAHAVSAALQGSGAGEA